MLIADQVQATGRHVPLIGPTSLEAERGEVLLVQAETALTRTALAMALAGRLVPDSGSITWDGDGSRRKLHRIAEVVDSPGTTAMEQQMRVRDYVAEMLSYAPHRPFRRPRPGTWLAQNGLEDLDNLYDEELTGCQRVRLAQSLAHACTSAELLVFDDPGRHTPDASGWLSGLQDLAADAEQQRAVVALVPEIPAAWHGSVAVAGDPESWVPRDLTDLRPLISVDSETEEI